MARGWSVPLRLMLHTTASIVLDLVIHRIRGRRYSPYKHRLLGLRLQRDRGGVL